MKAHFNPTGAVSLLGAVLCFFSPRVEGGTLPSVEFEFAGGKLKWEAKALNQTQPGRVPLYPSLVVDFSHDLESWYRLGTFETDGGRAMVEGVR